MKIMYALLFVLIIVLFLFLKTREHFALGVKADGWPTLSDHPDGVQLFSTFPDTCPPGQEKDAGLCYVKCRSGYHGVGPVCWADSVNIGIGTPVGLEPCPDGWKNDGLICREPIYNDCSWKGLFGECWGRLRGGTLRGRLNNGGVCPGPGGGTDHTEKISGLCYKKCPKDLPEHIPGMPYLCYIGGSLSYGRGVGKVPSILRLIRAYNPF